MVGIIGGNLYYSSHYYAIKAVAPIFGYDEVINIMKSVKDYTLPDLVILH
jgi:hypothetical protein